jgi:hypothetical protein
MPSKTPAATPADRPGRLPLIHRSTQELTSFLREASVERGVGEGRRAGPAAERDQHPQLRVLLLELGELVEVAGERLAGTSPTPSTLSSSENGVCQSPTGRPSRRHRPR